MRPISSLPWFLMVMGSTVLAAAGPGAPVRSQPRAEAKVEKPEPKREPTPTPAPRVAAKPTAAPKPVTAKVEPTRASPKAPAPGPMSKKSAELAASGSRALAVPKTAVGPESSTPRRSLRECDVWLGAVVAQHAALKSELAAGSVAMERIASDPSLAALPSDQNRQAAAIPAAEAMAAQSQRDWRQHLTGGAGRPAPAQVEQLMKQGETIAFRTNTSTADTQDMVAKIRRTPGVAAGGHVGLDAMAPDLMIAHLRALPGTLSGAQARQPYGVQNLEGLRARLEKGGAELDAQFNEVRQGWIASSTRADELHRKYLDLRRALVAPDE